MKAPGTAWTFDKQPAHMADYVDLPDDNDPQNDNGGVHINSGIPNHAFYLAATTLGGHAWEARGPHLVRDADRAARADLAVHRRRARRRSGSPATCSAAATSSAPSRRRGPQVGVLVVTEALDHPRRGSRRRRAVRTELASDALPDDAARALEAHASAVVAVAASGPPPRSPDEMLYDVCVERRRRDDEARYTDATLPEEVRALIAWADGRPERTDALEG